MVQWIPLLSPPVVGFNIRMILPPALERGYRYEYVHSPGGTPQQCPSALPTSISKPTPLEHAAGANQVWNSPSGGPISGNLSIFSNRTRLHTSRVWCVWCSFVDAVVD
ncbi:hypothetical protein CLAIMM_09107 [Cladophialophora immunda]|nr:hypothetical protein CLAIMM_09107 [Cladophialophora immunda]